MAKMSDLELGSIVAHEIKAAYGYVGSELAEERLQALDYYHGRPFGNEIQGRSSVVSRDVADTIEWMLPSLLRIFTSADDVVRFEPRQAEDEETAQQATDYVNWIVNQENAGFLLFYSWFKDALLQKVGVVKVLWDEQSTVTEERYDDLTDDELALLLQDGEVEVIEHEAEVSEGDEGIPAGIVTHDVRVRRKKDASKVTLFPVPPDEFLIAKRAATLETAPFVAHRVRKTVSDLIAEGYDRKQVEALPDYDEADWSLEAAARRVDQYQDTGESLDPTMREVAVTECYIRVDYDGDGVAEMRRVTVGGVGEASVILDNEPCDVAPFAAICPIMQPHEFYGLSVADLVTDIQLIKSTILRQMLDGMYLANNPRFGVLEDAVNIDDMLTSRPGGVVRMTRPDAVVPMATQWVGAQSFPMLEYVDGMRESRTGISKAFQGLDANALNNNTATAYAQMTNAAQSRVELIARIFAETGVKRLFQLVLGMVTKHQQKERIVRLRGKYVPMDPRGWTTEFDMSITVGLGTGNKDQQLQHLAMIAAKQEQVLAAAGPDNPLVGLDNLYNTYSKMIENAGLKSADAYFRDPQQATMQPQQPKPDPKVLEAQAKLQIEQQKIAAQIEGDRAKAEADIALAREKMAAEMALKREQMIGELSIKREVAMIEAQAKAMQPVMVAP